MLSCIKIVAGVVGVVSQVFSCKFYKVFITTFLQNTFTDVYLGPYKTFLMKVFAKIAPSQLLENSSKRSRLQMFFKIGVLKYSPIFTGKHFIKKKLQHRCFTLQLSLPTLANFLYFLILGKSHWLKIRIYSWIILQMTLKIFCFQRYKSSIWQWIP